MPQASDELRQRMLEFYGDEIADGPPLCFLLANGWKDNRGILTAPMPLYEVSDQELLSALFLRDEWDFDFNAGQMKELQDHNADFIREIVNGC